MKIFKIIFFGMVFFLGGYFLLQLKTIERVEFQAKVRQEPFFNSQPIEEQTINEGEEVTVILVGDIMLDRGVEAKIKKYGQGDFRFPFFKIADDLKKADLLFGNLESPISDKGTRVGSIYSFRADPQAIEGLVSAGFDVLALANNHTLDYGKAAFLDTFSRLKEAGIDYVGAGFGEKEAFSPVIKEIKGTKIGFLAYTNLGPEDWRAGKNSPGIAWISRRDFEKIKEDVEKAKQQVDILIVSFHGGIEYQKQPDRFQVDLAKMAIEAGADLIAGHHPHVVQPVEKYQEGYIAYSLGNFIFDQNFSEETMTGLLLRVKIENKEIKEAIPIKVKINQYFQPVAEQPAVESEAKQSENYQPVFSYRTTSLSKNLPGQSIKCLYKISGVPSPKAVVFSPDGKEFWVTSLMNKKRGVVVFDAKSGEHKKDIVLPAGGGVEIIFDREGSRAFVSQMETARVFEIDAQTKEILRIFETGGSWTKVLTSSPDENFLYSSNWISNDIAVIDLKSGKLIKKIPTVFTPRGIYATKDSSTLYVAGFGEGEIQKIDLETGKSSVLFKSGGAMRHIVGDEEKEVLYFSDMALAKIFKVNMKTGEVEELAKTDVNPNTIVLTPDKKILIVSNRGPNHSSGRINLPGPRSGSIYFFETANGKILATLTGGRQPTGLAISPDGRHFVYSDFLDGRVTLCEIPSFEETTTDEKIW